MRKSEYPALFALILYHSNLSLELSSIGYELSSSHNTQSAHPTNKIDSIHKL
jgi:hypothetical protein